VSPSLVPLKSIILEAKDGGTPSRKDADNFGGGVQWCVVKDIRPNITGTAETLTAKGLAGSSAKVWPVGSIIISLGATIGIVGIARVPTATKQGIAGIVVDPKKVSTEYLAHYLRFRRPEIQSFARGTTIKEVRPSALAERLMVPLPSLVEQQRIVTHLDEALEGVSAAVESTELNVLNAKCLFETARRTKFSTRDPSWEVRTLGEICENLDGRRRPVTKRDRVPGKVPYFGASGVVDYVQSHLFDEDLLLVSEDGANLLARTYPIAFSISGPSWVNNHAHALRFPDKRTQSFVEHYLNSIDLAPYVTGMAQPKLNQAALNKIRIPLPPVDRQAEVVASLERLHLEAQSILRLLELKLALLAELKQSLLARAFSGEMTHEPLAA
jgi:type I restriction enzyme S subunit